MGSLYFYSRGRLRYQVYVNDDGSIKVHWGDWLSKYAVAIYGTPFRVQEFARMGPHGLLPIKNLNMIYAGERIYYSPDYYASKHGAAVSDRPAPPLPLTDADKERLALDHFVHEFHLKGDDLRVVHEWLHYIDMGDEAAVEIGEYILELGTESAAKATVSLVGGLIGGVLHVLLIDVMITLSLIDALNTGQRAVQMAARAIALTRWAYGEGPPPFPWRLADKWVTHDKSATSVDRQGDVQVWDAGCNQVLDAVEKMLDKIEAFAKANSRRKSIPRDLPAQEFRRLLRAKYGQQKHRMAFALAKEIVEGQENYKDQNCGLRCWTWP